MIKKIWLFFSSPYNESPYLLISKRYRYKVRQDDKVKITSTTNKRG